MTGVPRESRGNKKNNLKYGYQKLIVWQNAYKLRRLVYEITGRFSRAEYRRVGHMRDSARSIKQNIQEGYTRKYRAEYIRFLNISQASAAELLGDIKDCLDDKLISEEEFTKLDSLTGRTEYLLKRLIQSLSKKAQS